ncbi:MauE/DoxX family redox-associated membrane protein [Actinomadura scrupuli]|uniref:MauE/DoxX family redox-associated membrane protein n=1 Tax=Actinomadura scrupuli TaxID=559629 RepID=UPI003D97CC73
MLEVLQETQVPFLASVLLAAALSKALLRGPDPPADAQTLDLLRHHRGMTIMVALTEGGLGLALLVTPHPSVRVATSIWFGAVTWIAGELRTRRPEAGCGCFGGLSTSRVGIRTVVRALLLTGAAVATMGVAAPGTEVLRWSLGWHGAVLVLEVAGLLALSPEVGVLLARHRLHVPCERRSVPLRETYATLHASGAWKEYLPVIAGPEPVEVWRELCWRFLVYAGYSDGREVEVVFAVSLESTRHPVVRAVIVGADEQDTEDSGPNPFLVVSV